jgi:hypothetical protein
MLIGVRHRQEDPSYQQSYQSPALVYKGDNVTEEYIPLDRPYSVELDNSGRQDRADGSLGLHEPQKPQVYHSHGPRYELDEVTGHDRLTENSWR